MRISEPLGRQYDLLVEDADGVWWWGDGYPGLGEHPDSNLKPGEVRRVSCLLQGSFDPFPRGLQQGTLVLTGQRAAWMSSQGADRQPLVLNVPVESVSTRPADASPHLNGVVGSVLMPSPVTVTCETPLG